jgi:hypothetical protein
MVSIAIVGNVSMSSLSPSTIDISKIDCDKVVYSANWGLELTLEVKDTAPARIRKYTNLEDGTYELTG